MPADLSADRTATLEPLSWRGTVEREFFGLPRVHRALLSQAPLTITTLVVVIFLALIDPALITNLLFVLGLSGVFLLVGVAALLRWKVLPDWFIWVIPLADFIAIGAMVHGANQSLSGLSLLSVFPVLWLSWSDMPPKFTRIIAFVGPLTIAWAPFLFGGVEPSRAGLIKPLLIPIIMLGLATAATVVTKSLQVQAERLSAATGEAQLRASQLDSIINVAEVGVVVVDGGGHDLLMNKYQQAIHSLALPAAKADSAEAELLVFGPDRLTRLPSEERPVRRAVNGEEYSGELYWIGSGTGQRAMSTSARQIVDECGARQGAVVVFHDVSEVMEAVAAQEDFVASVSHELRTPLTSILGYLELVLDDLDDDVAASYLKIVSRNAERLLRLVNDLLGSAREAMTLTPQMGDLQAILVSAVDAARHRAEQRNVRIHLDVESEMLGSFDRGRIGQAIDNLISNAVKFASSPGIVEVVGKSTATGLSVSVRDDGIGISPEEQMSLFTRFYRTESARQAAVPGVGLGLAITKTLADAHGGTVTVASTVGEGSTFRLSIPR